MSEDWKTAYKTWGDPVEDAAFDLFGKPVQRGFRSGYLAQAETVERLREALEPFARFNLSGFDCEVFEVVPSSPDNPSHRIEPIAATYFRRARQTLADLQPKETK